MSDPIVDEVRRVRGEHAARFNYDLWAIFRDIKEQQERSGLNFVSFADEASVECLPLRSGLSKTSRCRRPSRLQQRVQQVSGTFNYTNSP